MPLFDYKPKWTLGSLLSNPGALWSMRQPYRPVLQNPDGSWSTEQTMTEPVDVGGQTPIWYNIPTIWEGLRLNPDHAWQLFQAGLIQPTSQGSTLGEAERNARQRSKGKVSPYWTMR